MPKTDHINLRISPEFKQKLRQAAAAENRSVANYIECLLEEALGGDKRPEATLSASSGSDSGSVAKNP